MMIRTKLKLLAAGGGLLVLLACLLSWWGYQLIQMQQQRHDAIEQLQANAVSLNIITLDVLHNTHDQLQPGQWQIIYSDLGDNIADSQLHNQTTYPFLSGGHQKIGQEFNAYLQAHQACQQRPTLADSSASCQTLLSHLHTQVRLSLQDLLIEVNKIETRITAQSRHQSYIIGGLLLALPLLMSLFTVALALPITRALGVGLARMLEASDRFSQGDLGFRLRIDAQDEMGTLATTYNDMVQRREEAEKQLQENTEKYRALYENTPLSYQSLNEEGCFKDVNPAWLNTLGYDREEVIGKWFGGFLHPDWKPHFEKNFPEFKRRGYVHDIHFKMRHKDGHYLDIAFEGCIGYTPDGSFKQTYCVFQDITAREQAKTALATSEEKYRNLVESSQDWVWEVDFQGVYTYASPRCRELLGYEPEEIVGRTPFELMPESEAKRVLVKFQKIIAEAASVTTLENINLHKDGHKVVLETSGVPFFDDNGALAGYRGIDRDITERKRTEEEIRKLNQELEDRVRKRTSELQALNKELKSFAYSVSHDLRAPLRAIDGFSLALVEDYGEQLDETAHDYLQRVRNGAQRMGTLIDDMLQLSRVNRGKLVMEEVDLSKIAEAVVEELRMAEPGRRVKLILDTNMRVQGDPRLLQVMLDNLFSNAWKFSARETVSHITFKTKTDQPEMFYISDNGVGFDMRHADKLFGTFQRLHRVTDFPGTGVGLATVQRIVHRHGGRIWAEAQEGEGATFYFSLGTARVPRLIT